MPRLPKEVSVRMKKVWSGLKMQNSHKVPNLGKSTTCIPVGMNHTVHTVGRAPSPAKQLSWRLPKVSAIVVNWNGMEFLPTCLDSLYRQSYKNLEVIVVDCASKDESVSWMLQNYPKTKVIALQEDPGPPAAINLATRQAEGDYILILNNDVILPEHLVEKMAEELSKDENCVINPVEIHWEGEYVGSGISDSWFGRYLYYFIKANGDSPFYPSTACCLCTKGILLKNPLNEALFMYEDTEWGWRLQLKKIRLKVLKGSYFLHKGSGSQDTSYSPKTAYLVGRAELATTYICFKLATCFLLSPIILLEITRRIFRYIRKKKLKSIYTYFKGKASFFAEFSTYRKIRKIVQKDRQLNDKEILKRMIGSIGFEKQAKEEWISRRNKGEILYAPKAKPIKEKVIC